MSGAAPRPAGRPSRRSADRGTSRRRSPQRVDSLVGELFEALGIAERVERAGAVAEWGRIVGPHIARVTGEVRVSGRTLFVEVKSAAWLTELGMMRRELIEKLNAGRDRGRIERIVFVQAQGRG